MKVQVYCQPNSMGQTTLINFLLTLGDCLARRAGVEVDSEEGQEDE